MFLIKMLLFDTFHDRGEVRERASKILQQLESETKRKKSPRTLFPLPCGKINCSSFGYAYATV